MTTIDYKNKIKGLPENPLMVYKRTRIKGESIYFKSIVNNTPISIIIQYLEEVSDPNDGIVRRCSSCNRMLVTESYLIKGDCISQDKDVEYVCCWQCQNKRHFKNIYEKWTGGDSENN